MSVHLPYQQETLPLPNNAPGSKVCQVGTAVLRNEGFASDWQWTGASPSNYCSSEQSVAPCGQSLRSCTLVGKTDLWMPVLPAPAAALVQNWPASFRLVDLINPVVHDGIGRLRDSTGRGPSQAVGCPGCTPPARDACSRRGILHRSILVRCGDGQGLAGPTGVHPSFNTQHAQFGSTRQRSGELQLTHSSAKETA
ncbi:hypothetical protein N658DRAFT_495841 [Parathielavia hyrcaniae]|uniref:Uncharacterized protein n=1 Tax=Parathielavia hyrcaniae TaxID=113614 RepID=A0AAN6T2R1_9PEZI|nr:hypothetical protein N658DRAFT_495841 [Parathielavia hyrcaniae]